MESLNSEDSSFAGCVDEVVGVFESGDLLKSDSLGLDNHLEFVFSGFDELVDVLTRRKCVINNYREPAEFLFTFFTFFLTDFVIVRDSGGCGGSCVM